MQLQLKSKKIVQFMSKTSGSNEGVGGGNKWVFGSLYPSFAVGQN
jgi:hypothetical protein